MFFKANTKKLKELVNKISGITPNLVFYTPESSGLYLELFENKLSFEAKNEYISIKVESTNIEDIAIHKTGKALFKLKILLDIVNHLKGETVEFHKIEENLMIIKTEFDEYEINLLNAEKFEKTTHYIEASEELTLNSQVLLKNLQKVFYACNERNSRKTLQGIHFRNTAGHLHLTATDSARISTISQLTNSDTEINKIVHVKALKEMTKTLSNEEEVQILFDHKYVVIKGEEVSIKAQLIEGVFPIVDKLFPAHTDNELTIERTELNEMLNKVTLVNTNKNDDKVIIKMSIHNGKLKLETREIEVGFANVQTNHFTWKGKEIFNISFNPKFLNDAIKSSDENSIKIQFIDSEKPFVITGVKDHSHKNLIIPFKVISNY